jgi:response regulator of citrate/malate metabolism
MTEGRPVIRTLVVDDDFRVARIHAASVERIEGFVCVGQAHTAAEARDHIERSQPDLLMSLTGAGSAPDCIFITAARDLESVRAAIGLGAMFYLVKPFGFVQLKEKLDAYRRWHAELAASPEHEADQETVDALYEMLRGASGTTRPLPPTTAKILEAVRRAEGPVSASSIAEQLGISRPTAQRYLTDLHKRGVLDLDLEYRATGRPVNLYRPHR